MWLFLVFCVACLLLPLTLAAANPENALASSVSYHDYQKKRRKLSSSFSSSRPKCRCETSSGALYKNSPPGGAVRRRSLEEYDFEMDTKTDESAEEYDFEMDTKPDENIEQLRESRQLRLRYFSRRYQSRGNSFSSLNRGKDKVVRMRMGHYIINGIQVLPYNSEACSRRRSSSASSRPKSFSSTSLREKLANRNNRRLFGRSRWSAWIRSRWGGYSRWSFFNRSPYRRRRYNNYNNYDARRRYRRPVRRPVRTPYRRPSRVGYATHIFTCPSDAVREETPPPAPTAAIPAAPTIAPVTASSPEPTEEVAETADTTTQPTVNPTSEDTPSPSAGSTSAPTTSSPTSSTTDAPTLDPGATPSSAPTAFEGFVLDTVTAVFSASDSANVNDIIAATVRAAQAAINNVDILQDEIIVSGTGEETGTYLHKF